MEKQFAQRVQKSIILCSLYLLIIFFHYHIDKVTKGNIFALLTVTIITFTFVIYIKAINWLILAIRSKAKAKIKWIPFVIYLVVAVGVTYAWWQRAIPTSEVFESRVILRGCYEGTMNHATLKFRSDSTFEIHWMSLLASNWHYGKWRRSGDTITFVNNGSPITPLNDTLIIVDTLDHKFFVPFKNQYTTSDFQWFYLGECMGYN